LVLNFIPIINDSLSHSAFFPVAHFLANHIFIKYDLLAISVFDAMQDFFVRILLKNHNRAWFQQKLRNRFFILIVFIVMVKAHQATRAKTQYASKRIVGRPIRVRQDANARRIIIDQNMIWIIVYLPNKVVL
jgi:hypothetical protein